MINVLSGKVRRAVGYLDGVFRKVCCLRAPWSAVRKGEMEHKKMMGIYPGTITFTFLFEKLLDTLTYLASKINDLDELKTIKLVYLADRLHLLKYGRPITGDRYYHLRYGPVPTLTLDYVRDLIDPSRRVVPEEKLALLGERIAVVPSKEKHPGLKATGSWEVEYLSTSDIVVLDKIIAEYGGMSGPDLIDLTHKHSTWLDTRENSEIPYELFFKNAPEAEETAYKFMLATQEDRDFISYLSK